MAKQGGCRKKSRKSRVSLGREGHPARARTSVGVQRLINQLDAHKAGKKVKLTVPGNTNLSGINVNLKVFKGTLRDYLTLRTGRDVIDPKLQTNKMLVNMTGKERWSIDSGKRNSSKQQRKNSSQSIKKEATK